MVQKMIISDYLMLILASNSPENFSGISVPSLILRMFLSSWYRKDSFHMGVLSSAFRRERGGQNILLLSAVFHIPLAQNNLQAKVAFLRVAYSAILHPCPPPHFWNFPKKFCHPETELMDCSKPHWNSLSLENRSVELNSSFLFQGAVL